MSRVGILASARDSLSVKFLEFIRIASHKERVIAVFFEGEDEKYYSIRINLNLSEFKWAGIKCGGKRNVILMREKLIKHKDYNHHPSIFFVDADFDNNSNIKEQSNTYITPCYSVENLYVSDDAYKKILTAEFGLSEYGEEADCFKNCMNLFSISKKEYIENITDFNYWIRTCRVLEKKGHLLGKLNINNVSFKDLVKVNIDSCDKKYGAKDLPKLFRGTPPVSLINNKESEIYFSDKDKEMWFRGKQHLEFLRSYMNILKEDRCKKDCRILFKEKGNVKLNMTKGNCISELSQYADTPKCLIKFFNNFRNSELLSTS